MSDEKQIEEMAKCCPYYHKGKCCEDVLNIRDCDVMCEMFGVFSNLAKEGYRKQVEGEWMDNLYCSSCGYCYDTGEYSNSRNYCPNCGAKMKGGE